MRTIIVSNRLPITIQQTAGGINYKTSEGGLATGLNSIYQECNSVWIGWPGLAVEERHQAKITDDLSGKNLYPVYLSDKEIQDYYEGFSNETLWPLFHYFPNFSSFLPHHWECYKAVNQKFAEAIIKIACPGDTVWIHDYQLMLVPELVRSSLPHLTIGFFQHIPFPSYEVFRAIPWRKELLYGLMGADMIGFHTYDDVKHYIDSVEQLTNIKASANELEVDKRKVTIDAFPISIDYRKFNDAACEARTQKVRRKIKQLVSNNKLLMSVDRLDYSKGIIHRLQAYKQLLQQHPELHGKVRLVQLIVPSRDKVQKYKELKEEVNKMVGEINGDYSTFGWQPIHHFYRSFPPTLLSALYSASDVALVTPVRDGMNLVCKEYVASRIDKKGVLILSEMAGASRELSDAIIVNPNDIADFAAKIYDALQMPEAEQKTRMSNMQEVVSKFDVKQWCDNFINKLTSVAQNKDNVITRPVTPVIRANMLLSYRAAAQRLILLDYDGTLVPFKTLPEDACPDTDLLALLETLASDPSNTVVITSGRDYHTLDKWFGHLEIDIIAEHGAWYKYKNRQWKKYIELTNDGWYPAIRDIMIAYAERTPGAFIEEKSYSLVWHYRASPEELGETRAKTFMNDIKQFVSSYGLQVLPGSKAVEIKTMSVNKGLAVQRWLNAANYEFIISLGDDYTDEDTFKALPGSSYSVKVGNADTIAIYSIESWLEARGLLANLAFKKPQVEPNIVDFVKVAS